MNIENSGGRSTQRFISQAVLAALIPGGREDSLLNSNYEKTYYYGNSYDLNLNKGDYT